jgi:arylsulfatase A-like enzyme
MTRESFPSMLAGRPPSRIHWLDQQNNYPYPVSHEDNHFLAEYLSEAGIATAFAVPFKYPVNAHFDQGFGEKKVEPSSKFKNDTSAEKVVDDAIAELGTMTTSGKQFFLWVHFYEAHHPYVEHKGFERGKSELKRYLSEIAWIDSQIGRLLTHVDSTTAVIFTGDHGEEFGEHGGQFHGDLHIEDLHVPLIVAMPGQTPGAMDVPVSLLELAPTIAELLGIAIPDTFFGESWVPWLEGEAPPEDRTVYAEVLPDRKQPRRLLTVIDARWQLIVDFQLGGRELYDLSKDPWGKRNLVADNPVVARDLEIRLRRAMALRMNPVVVTKAESERKEVPIDDE